MQNENFHAKIDAMFHIESAIDEIERSGSNNLEPNIELIHRRLWAAEYLIQSMDGGVKPENWDETMHFPEDMERD